MLKLYHNPRSTYSRRVRIALAEKRIAHEEVVVDMAKRGHKSPEYLSLNPYGRVPTIDDNGFVLFESTAILNYLEATRPAPPLLPADAKQRALVDMHMKLCDIQMGRYTGIIIFPKRFLPKEKWDMAAIAAAKEEIEKHIAILERQLTGKRYLVAEQFTLAEVCYLPFLQSVEEIAKADRVSPSDVSRALPLAFLAPSIVEAILAGTQPPELTAERLRRMSSIPHCVSAWNKDPV